MDTDLEELKRLCAAATACTWVAWAVESRSINPDEAYFVAGPQRRCMDHSAGFVKEDAEFIAAANPATVSDLITRLEKALVDAERYRHIIELGTPELCICIDGVPNYIGETKAGEGAMKATAAIDAAMARG